MPRAPECQISGFPSCLSRVGYEHPLAVVRPGADFVSAKHRRSVGSYNLALKPARIITSTDTWGSIYTTAAGSRSRSVHGHVHGPRSSDRFERVRRGRWNVWARKKGPSTRLSTRRNRKYVSSNLTARGHTLEKKVACMGFLPQTLTLKFLSLPTSPRAGLLRKRHSSRPREERALTATTSLKCQTAATRSHKLDRCSYLAHQSRNP